MLAPIDARAEVQVGDDTVVLRLNFRTLALAKSLGVNLMLLSLTDIDPIDMAYVIEAFARPEQPDFSADEAFALIQAEPEGVRDALLALSTEFAAATKPLPGKTEGGTAKSNGSPRKPKPGKGSPT